MGVNKDSKNKEGGKVELGISRELKQFRKSADFYILKS